MSITDNDCIKITPIVILITSRKYSITFPEYFNCNAFYNYFPQLVFQLLYNIITITGDKIKKCRTEITFSNTDEIQINIQLQLAIQTAA